MPLALVKRIPLGAPISAAQNDQNMTDIENAVNANTGDITLINSGAGAVYTKTATDAAIAAAVAAIPQAAGQGLFKAAPSVDQDIVHAAPGSLTTDVAFGTEVFDPDAVFATDIFTAPADGFYEFDATFQAFVFSGSPTQVTIDFLFVSSVGDSDFLQCLPDDDPATAQRFYTGTTKLALSMGDTVKVSVETGVDAAATIRIGSNSYFTGQRIR